MKLLSLILAVILVCSLFGCAPKNTDLTEKEEETTAVDTKDEGEKTDPADSTDSDTSASQDEETDAFDKEEVTHKNEDDKKEPSDSVSSDKENSDTTAESPSTDRAPADDDDKDSSVPADTDEKKPEDTEESSDYTDGIVIEAYLPLLAGHFSSNYKKADGAPDTSLIHLTAIFLYTQRRSDVEISDDNARFAVSGATMEKTMRLLFGNDVSLSDYTSYLDADMGDKYDKDSDTYSFDAYRQSWGEGSYAFSMDHSMKVKEKSSSLEISATLINAKGKERAVTYKFSKVVSGSYLYFRLEEVKVK